MLLFLLIASLLLNRKEALAEETTSPALLVEQTFINDVKTSDDEFEYTFVPQSNQEPMPYGSQDNIYSFSIKGTAKYEIPAISFDKTGVYQYNLNRVDSSSDISGAAKDYLVTYYVMNQDSGGLTTQTVVQNQKGEKVDPIVFAYDNSASASSEKQPKSVVHTGDKNKVLSLIIILIAATITCLVLFRKEKMWISY